MDKEQSAGPESTAAGSATSAAVLRDGALAGRTCIVTGAGSGIGRSIALRFAMLGARVIGLGRRIEALEETRALLPASAGSFEPRACDVRDGAAAAAIVSEIGDAHGLDILVNNAGGQFAARAESITKNGWDAVIALNLSAVFALSSAAFPYLAKRGGSIINISLSLAERGTPGLAHSVAARAGVLGLTRSLALEWARHGIRLNCIGPGIVATEMTASRYLDVAMSQTDGATPLGRPTSPEEIAELAAFLASPAGELMTGQLLQIDGGMHIGAGLSMLDAVDAHRA